MAPLPTTTQTLSPVTAILSNIYKRSYDACTYYDTSCSNTHRIVILIIILFVGFLVGMILSLVYFRSRRRRMARERQARIAREQRSLSKMTQPFQGVEYEAPPPYMPRRPERSAARPGQHL